MSGPMKSKGSYADKLYKKETKGKWVPYWVTLDGKYLKFYETNKSEKLIGSVEIGSKSKCVVSKRKTYSFPFLVCAAHGRHLFKCDSAPRRHMWMTAIHQAVELLNFPTSTENDLRISDVVNKAVTDNVEDGDEDVLPHNVLLVTSLPAACDSPSLPFKLRNRVEAFSDNITESQQTKTSPKPTTPLYPFIRNSEESAPKVSDEERKQFSSLNIRSHSLFDQDSFSPRVRSFPSTPEKCTRPISPAPTLTLNASYFGKSRSMSSLTSSQTDMRFSRHMVSGGDCCDLEL